MASPLWLAVCPWSLLAGLYTIFKCEKWMLECRYDFFKSVLS